MKTKLLFFAFSILAFNFLFAQTEKPNVVFILLDDLGWSDLGCFGSEIPTPNIDNLAYNGLRCTNFYNASKCTPSRAMLLTGVYAHQNGFGQGDVNAFFNNATTLGEVLKTANYNTAIVGKHHAGENLFNRGFDKAYGLLDGAMNYFNPGLQRIGENAPAQKANRKWFDNDLQFFCKDSAYQNYFPPNFYSTVNFTDKAIEYLQDFENNTDPFFLYLSYNAPHFPLQAPDSLINQFNGFYDVGYNTIRKNRFEKQAAIGLIDTLNYPFSAADIPIWDDFEETVKQEEIRRMQTYAAMIKMVDIQIGKLLNYLDATNQRENTIIFIASDNGASAEAENFGSGEIGSLEKYATTGFAWAQVSNTPLRKWKKSNFEGGICSPLIINWQNGLQNEGRIINEKLHFLDVMPTLLNLCNANYKLQQNNEYVTAMQGEDFSNIIFNQPLAQRTKPLFFKWEDQKAIIYDNKKAVYNIGPQNWDFYNLQIDATETTDLETSEPTILQGYVEEYNDWFVRVNQKSPVALPDTLEVAYNKNSFINIFSNDFDEDDFIDFSKTKITKQPNNGIINFVNDTTTTYLHFYETYQNDTFEYVIYDGFEAFSQPTKVILKICENETDCNVLLDNQSINYNSVTKLLFPNPAKNHFYFITKNVFDINEFEIYNIEGKRIENYNFEKIADTKFKFDIENLTIGQYFLKSKQHQISFLKM